MGGTELLRFEVVSEDELEQRGVHLVEAAAALAASAGNDRERAGDQMGLEEDRRLATAGLPGGVAQVLGEEPLPLTLTGGQVGPAGALIEEGRGESGLGVEQAQGGDYGIAERLWETAVGTARENDGVEKAGGGGSVGMGVGRRHRG